MKISKSYFYNWLFLEISQTEDVNFSLSFQDDDGNDLDLRTNQIAASIMTRDQASTVHSFTVSIDTVAKNTAWFRLPKSNVSQLRPSDYLCFPSITMADGLVMVPEETKLLIRVYPAARAA